jgi:hypothetical protein
LHAPIGALARYNEEEDTIHFQGVLFSTEKKKQVDKLFLSKNGRNWILCCSRVLK